MMILCFHYIEVGIMYENQLIATRIKSTAKLQNKKMKDMLNTLGLGINLISQLANGSNITAVNLAQIADYLDCSVDYLLGRTDKREINR